MPSPRLRQAIDDVLAKGMVWYAKDGSNLVFLPNALKLTENAPESPNAVKAWVRLCCDLPKTDFYFKCLCHWQSLSEGITHALTHAFLKALPMPPIQEQEQEQEQNKEILSSFEDSPSPSSNGIPYKDIIDYLNQKTGKHFRAGKETLAHIRARWNTGFRLEDFKSVIDIKCEQWLKDAKMMAYLRPETLFGTKFDSYLNERVEIIDSPDYDSDLGMRIR